MGSMSDLPVYVRLAAHRATVLLVFVALVVGGALGYLGERSWVRKVTDSGTWLRDRERVLVDPSDTVLTSFLGANWKQNEVFFRILTRGDGLLDPTNTLD